jgi:hypothetical protein
MPGQMLPVSVKVSPPAIYSVRFSLVGDVQDAFLDKSETATDGDGTASIALTAPSSSAAFTLRASVPGGSAEVGVSTDTETTTLEVVPAYAGQRPVTTWVASVSTGSPCDPFAQVPPTDGALRSEPTAGGSVLVTKVPLNSALRVTVRAGHFAGGCTDVPAFVVGERRSVSVTVTDRPLQMGGVSIPVILGIDRDAAWTSAWSALASQMATAVVNGSASDADALLDAMSVQTPYLSQDAFNDERAVAGWTARVARVLSGGPGATVIRDSITRWVTAGLSTLASAAVTGTLTSPAVPLGTATLSVDTVGGDGPSTSGFPSLLALTWGSAPSDQLLFGATGWWQPSKLAATLAESAAKKEVSSATSVSSALSRLLSCKDVGVSLADNDVQVSCDADCMTSRCEDALDAMWNRAAGTALTRALVHVTASGSANIDDNARPVGFSGSWVGDASLGGVATRVSGAASSSTKPAGTR